MIRMNRKRKDRIAKAKEWFKKQEFKNEDRILKAYKKEFHVDSTCARRDLVMMHVLSPEKQKEFEDKLERRKQRFERKRQRRKERKEREEAPLFEQDETFYYIAGYTSGGAPFGITWEGEARIEEAERRAGEERKNSGIDYDDDLLPEDLPF